MRIESIGDRYAILQEYYSSLLSPSRIYNYAKSNLNMVTASRIETIRLMSDSFGGNAQSDAPVEVTEVARTPRGLGGFFSRIANAKD